MQINKALHHTSGQLTRMKNHNHQDLTLRLPAQVRIWVRVQAATQGVHDSDVVQRALDHHLDTLHPSACHNCKYGQSGDIRRLKARLGNSTKRQVIEKSAMLNMSMNQAIATCLTLEMNDSI
ncbi:hypothetical protein [Bifidobacterium gallicum]|uniref:Uncharacterized protein n=1 Tax=Bifidobacterium gallicum DSM 20093 = LMG 11596 TaxID=561180 RepID=D1NTT4_9BIFI|nr:hypothetical protein [Bifidobacterium gallicum]EFA23138.1 hypothetical protein BIFGAL_03251 [Bifidobacterium gallicum DSM 20093 = LMG 11596]KFI58812.1 hypothetical protein BGLCM_1107 [Bifidobacterium gallicum DSM 20093 = LMG 11596]